MPSRLDIIRRAQARIGDEPIASEAAAGADLYITVFESVRDDLLSRYPWYFATVTRRLGRLAQEPSVHWRYFFQLPSEMLGAPRAVYDSAQQRAPYTRYELTENRLATDAERIWLRFINRAEPQIWPAYFTAIVEKSLMREYALSVREDSNLYRLLGEELFGPPSMMGEGGLYGQAKSHDTQAKPSPMIAAGSSPLIDARFS